MENLYYSFHETYGHGTCFVTPLHWPDSSCHGLGIFLVRLIVWLAEAQRFAGDRRKRKGIAQFSDINVDL